MKKELKLVLLVALLICLSTVSRAQAHSTANYKPVTYTCNTSSVSFWNADKQDWENRMVFEDQNISVHLGSTKVEIKAETTTTVYLLHLERDRPNDFYYSAIDNKGIDCALQIAKIDNTQWTIQLIYENALCQYTIAGSYPF